jgi:hypothetical protein
MGAVGFANPSQIREVRDGHACSSVNGDLVHEEIGAAVGTDPDADPEDAARAADRAGGEHEHAEQ